MEDPETDSQILLSSRFTSTQLCINDVSKKQFGKKDIDRNLAK